MTRNCTLLSLLGFVVAWGEVSAQATVISNYSSGPYQVGQTVSQGGLVTSSYYDPNGPGYQFPSPQFPSTQFPSVSTPAGSLRGAFGPGPYGTTTTAVSTYGVPNYAAPGTPAVTYASPTGTAAPYVAAPAFNPYPGGYPAVTYAQPVVPVVPGAPAAAIPVAPPIAPITSPAPARALQPIRTAYPTGAYSSLGGSNIGGGSVGGMGAPAIQSVYPQPGQPRGPTTTPYIGAGPTGAPGLVVQRLPLEAVLPMERYTPGLATIRDGKWMVSDMLYNLPINIAIKVDVIKPQDRYTPVSDKQIEKQIADIFRAHFITPEPYPLLCEPVLPVFQITLFTYPCERRCVGVVTAQLYEKGKPRRIDTDINGIWQMVTWQRQTLIASSCDDFEQEVLRTIGAISTEFGRIFKYYHEIPNRPCFNTEERPIWARP